MVPLRENWAPGFSQWTRKPDALWYNVCFQALYHISFDSGIFFLQESICTWYASSFLCAPTSWMRCWWDKCAANQTRMEIPLQQIIQFHSLPVCLCESIRFSPWPMAQTNLIYNPDKNVSPYSPFMRSFWKNTRSYRTPEVMTYMILVLVSGVSHNTILLNQTVSLEEIKNPLYECCTVPTPKS